MNFLNSTKAISKKEIQLFFSSPTAYLFLGVFSLANLFIVFWVESFFSRNIADVRPLFEWMPVVLIFLSAALTMKMWSEERRTGTLEHVLTLPVPPWAFVLGKFFACMVLLTLALLLTLPIPISVSLIGNLDWGPVICAYLAALFLGATYLAIGLFVSSRSDNQIVSLIMSVLIGGFFYLLGAPTITELTPTQTGELPRQLSTSTRFESIARGVLDLRDIYFYVCLALIFLVANRYALEKVRWTGNKPTHHQRRWQIATMLLILNLVAANLWLSPINALRIDTTQGQQYSLSQTTKNYLAQLQEPLKITGYFSSQTHPLLAPLVPQLKNIMLEYEALGKGRVRAEFLDPAKDQSIEEEVGTRFGIRPTPFRVADRYQAAVVNSYFNIVIEYGDEFEVLNFQDLIATRQDQSDFEVALKNPEYDLTGAIRHVLHAYQSEGDVFDSIDQPIQFTAYISGPQVLPKPLADFKQTLESTLSKYAETSSGKFKYEFIDPRTAGDQTPQLIADRYGFQPMATSLFDTTSFYFHFLLSNGKTELPMPIPEQLEAAALERQIEDSLKRFARGLTRTVGLVAPPSTRAQPGFSNATPQFNTLEQYLAESMNVVRVDLSEGNVPHNIDFLALLAPEALDEKAVFALDQYLMRGGAVLLASSPVNARFSPQGLNASTQKSGLEDWLKHHGIEIPTSLVLDETNTAFPVPVTRQVGMFQVQEMQLVDYPWFVDVRGQGFNEDNPSVSALPSLTLPWVSQVRYAPTEDSALNSELLLQSSSQSWTNNSLVIQPPAPRVDQPTDAPYPLALSFSGVFHSYFEGKNSPLTEQAAQEESESDEANSSNDENDALVRYHDVIQRSTEAAKLIVIGTNSLAEDQVTNVLSNVQGHELATPFEFITNLIDWSLEDEGMLSIRTSSPFNRTLPSMTDAQRRFWEYLNYGLAAAFLLVILLCHALWHMRKHQYQKSLLHLQSVGGH